MAIKTAFAKMSVALKLVKHLPCTKASKWENLRLAFRYLFRVSSNMEDHRMRGGLGCSIMVKACWYAARATSLGSSAWSVTRPVRRSFGGVTSGMVVQLVGIAVRCSLRCNHRGAGS